MNNIQYITDVSYSRENTFKFIVAVNGKNIEVSKEEVKYHHSRKGQTCLKIGNITVFNDMFIKTESDAHLSEIVIAIEIVKVIIESVGGVAFGGES